MAEFPSCGPAWAQEPLPTLICHHPSLGTGVGGRTLPEEFHQARGVPPAKLLTQSSPPLLPSWAERALNWRRKQFVSLPWGFGAQIFGMIHSRGSTKRPSQRAFSIPHSPVLPQRKAEALGQLCPQLPSPKAAGRASWSPSLSPGGLKPPRSPLPFLEGCEPDSGRKKCSEGAEMWCWGRWGGMGRIKVGP